MNKITEKIWPEHITNMDEASLISESYHRENRDLYGFYKHHRKREAILYCCSWLPDWWPETTTHGHFQENVSGQCHHQGNLIQGWIAKRWVGGWEKFKARDRMAFSTNLCPYWSATLYGNGEVSANGSRWRSWVLSRLSQWPESSLTS